MTLPSCVKNNTWQWIIGTIIAIAAITVPLVLTRPSDPPHKISTIDGDDNIQVVDSPGAKIIKTGTSPEDRQRQETTLENTEQIIRLLEEKGYDANPQFVSELKDKIQKLEKKQVTMRRPGNFLKHYERKKGKKRLNTPRQPITWAMYILLNWIFQRH